LEACDRPSKSTAAIESLLVVKDESGRLSWYAAWKRHDLPMFHKWFLLTRGFERNIGLAL
jgi:hypothetical protein